MISQIVIVNLKNPSKLLDALLQDVFNRKFCGNGVPDWVPQPPEFNFPYPMEVEYEVDENGYPSR